MVQSDYDSFVEVVVGFAELKGKVLSPAAIKLYWAAMQHWELIDFRQAAAKLLRSCAFMPTPKDFEDLRKAGNLTPGEAWTLALKAARRNERSSGDPLIDKAVQAIGGYRAIGMSEVDKTHFLETRFCEHYESMEVVEDIRKDLPQIANQQSTYKLTGGPTSAASVLARLGRNTNDTKQ